MSTESPASPTSPPGFTSNRRIITVALLLAMAAASLETTVVSTALPSITSSLQGFKLFPWLVSGYLLASTISTPVYGKLADLFGRKKVLLFGLALFTAGSIASGLAQSMPQLIAMRVVQGLGSGAVAPIVLTMLSDLYSLEERPRIQGWFSAVWGISSLAGPALGGWLTVSFSWRWVFFVIVPFTVVAAWVLITQVRETVARHGSMPLDWPGALLLALGTSALLLTAIDSENRASIYEYGLVAAAVVFVGLFVAWERVARDPMLPIDLIRLRPMAATLASGFLAWWLMFGLITYVPLYVQGVLGRDANAAGRSLSPLFFFWALGIMLAAKLILRYGFRNNVVAGTAIVAGGIGLLLLGAGQAAHMPWYILAGMTLAGIGFGPLALGQLLSVQVSVPWNRRGAATASITFFRMIGSAVGVGILSAVLTGRLARRLPGWTSSDLTAALRPDTHSKLDPERLRLVQAALGDGLVWVFAAMLGLALLGTIVSFWLPAGEHRDSAEAKRELEEAEPFPEPF